MALVPSPDIMATWPEPNYVNPHTEVSLLRIMVCVGVVIVAFALFLRWLGAHYTRRAFAKHDAMIIFSAVTALAMLIVIGVATLYGQGYHTWDAKQGWQIHAGKTAFVTQITWTVAVPTTKLSILLAYDSWFWPETTNKIFCRVLFCTISAWTIAVVACTIFQCNPIHAYWDVTNKGKCINAVALVVPAGIINSITDGLVFLWPIHALMKLNMPIRTRIGLIWNFLLGLLVVGSGIARIVIVYNAIRSRDPLYAANLVEVMCIVEVAFGVLCACLPFSKPVWVHYVPRLYYHVFGKGYLSRPRCSATPDSKFSHLKLPSNETQTLSSRPDLPVLRGYNEDLESGNILEPKKKGVNVI